MRPMKNNRAAFTYIELLIALAVVAVSFLPLMRMYTVSLEQAGFTDDLSAAKFLAQEGMEKVKNLNFTKAQLKDIGDVWWPTFGKPPHRLNKKTWRVLRDIVESTDPLEIRIKVFKDEDLSQGGAPRAKPVLEIATLFEDLEWYTPEI